LVISFSAYPGLQFDRLTKSASILKSTNHFGGQQNQPVGPSSFFQSPGVVSDTFPDSLKDAAFPLTFKCYL